MPRHTKFKNHCSTGSLGYRWTKKQLHCPMKKKSQGRWLQKSRETQRMRISRKSPEFALTFWVIYSTLTLSVRSIFLQATMPRRSLIISRSNK